MKARRGTSLVELIVVMSACAVFFTTAAEMIHRAMFAESQSRAFANVERTSLRLSRDWRQDVHRALSVANSGGLENVLVKLEITASESVQYLRERSAIVRTIELDGRMHSREVYTFPTEITAEVRELESPRELVLTVSAEPHSAADADKKRVWNQHMQRIALQSAAVLARNFRFQIVSGDEKEQP